MVCRGGRNTFPESGLLNRCAAYLASQPERIPKKEESPVKKDIAQKTPAELTDEELAQVQGAGDTRIIKQTQSAKEELLEFPGVKDEKILAETEMTERELKKTAERFSTNPSQGEEHV